MCLSVLCNGTVVEAQLTEQSNTKFMGLNPANPGIWTREQKVMYDNGTVYIRPLCNKS